MHSPPNGDGINDYFEIKSQCDFENFKLSIYDRWGRRVYVGYNINEFWDGNFEGSPCEQGTYLYILEINPFVKSTPKQTYKGDITLIR